MEPQDVHPLYTAIDVVLSPHSPRRLPCYQHQRTHVADSSVQRRSGVFDKMFHRLERFSFAREMPTLHCMAGTEAYCQDAVHQSVTALERWSGLAYRMMVEMSSTVVGRIRYLWRQTLGN